MDDKQREGLAVAKGNKLDHLDATELAIMFLPAVVLLLIGITIINSLALGGALACAYLGLSFSLLGSRFALRSEWRYSWLRWERFDELTFVGMLLFCALLLVLIAL